MFRTALQNGKDAGALFMCLLTALVGATLFATWIFAEKLKNKLLSRIGTY